MSSRPTQPLSNSMEGTSDASLASVVEERRLAEERVKQANPRRLAAEPSGEVVAQVTAVSKRFLGTLALNDVSLKLMAGEMFGLVGPNGAGKTTLLRILATLIPPDSGEVKVCGFGLHEVKKIRGVIGFMPDVLGVYDDMLVREYLEFFARASSLPPATRDFAVNETMLAVGIQHLAEQPVDGLSRGMKQRLCLGRSILHNPKLLLLDEPASGLDPLARIELREILRSLQRKGATIVISSHVLEDLADMCDRIGVVSRGRLICVDETKNMIEQQGTRRLRVRALNRSEELFDFLKSYSQIDGVRWDNDHILFRLGGNEENDLSELLKELVEKDFPVVSFYEEPPTLESAYMNVTQVGEDGR